MPRFGAQMQGGLLRQPTARRKGSLMRSSVPPVAANLSRAPGQGLDRDALDRARGAIRSLPHVLPAESVVTLAREVISRMAAQHRSVRAPDCPGAETMAEALVAADEAAAMRHVMRLLSSGVAVDDIYLVHLAGASRLLGRWWDDDVLSSSQVTIAAARTYAIMRGIASRLLPPSWPDGRHAVFATVPGERHTLGVSMAADLFRREGWLIDLMVGRQHDELLADLVRTDFTILALSASTPAVLPDLARLIAAVRIAAPHALVLICGRLVQEQPDLCRRSDADAATDDLAEARSRMEAHLAVMGHYARALKEETRER